MAAAAAAAAVAAAQLPLWVSWSLVADMYLDTIVVQLFQSQAQAHPHPHPQQQQKIRKDDKGAGAVFSRCPVRPPKEEDGDPDTARSQEPREDILGTHQVNLFYLLSNKSHVTTAQ